MPEVIASILRKTPTVGRKAGMSTFGSSQGQKLNKRNKYNWKWPEFYSWFRKPNVCVLDIGGGWREPMMTNTWVGDVNR